MHAGRYGRDIVVFAREPVLSERIINISRARFTVGELVHHRLFDYRGVIFDVDRRFEGSEDWYRSVARSRPPRDKPWYHVLVHGHPHTTYVAERNLELDDCIDPIEHPLLRQYFTDFEDGRYLPREPFN